MKDARGNEKGEQTLATLALKFAVSPSVKYNVCGILFCFVCTQKPFAITRHTVICNIKYENSTDKHVTAKGFLMQGCP